MAHPAAPVEKEVTIQYMGMIANPQKKLKIATISMNGKALLVREKDKIDGMIANPVKKIKNGDY
jgi:hypothetical protein